MNYQRHALRTFRLSILVVLGLMAFTSTGAQASGKVLVEGLTSPFTVAITGQAENALASSLLLLGWNVEFFCHQASAAGSLTSSGSGTATITFENCLAQGVNAGGALTGAVCAIPNIVATVKALVILHSGNIALTTTQHHTGIGEPYILFTPENGLTFATLLSHTECALPEVMNLKGCVVAKVVTTGDLVTHLISGREMSKLFGCKLNYGAHEVHFSPDGLVSLAGSHTGLKWGMASSTGKVVVLNKNEEALPPFLTVPVLVEDNNALEESRLILNLNMEIFCHKMKGTGTISNSGHLVLKPILEKCLTRGTGGGGTCEIPNIEGKYLGLVILHSGSTALTTALHSTGTGEPYILFTPEDNLTFEKVLNHTECALPENANVKGCFVAKVTTTGHRIVHSLSTKGMSALFGCKMKYGANEMHLSSEMLIFLSGEHLGLEWGLE